MTAAFIDKAHVKQAFSAASATYDGAAYLQRAVALDLLDPVCLENMAGLILDLGCGTGFLTEKLLLSSPRLKGVVALDLALPMLQTSRFKLNIKPGYINGARINYLCADAACLPIADHHLDGLFSNLALQWCHPLAKVLSEIKRVLKPGSPLAVSTFGPATLREFKKAWAEVDSFKHVNDFYSAEELCHFLKQFNFTDIRITSRIEISQYDSVKALMKELKQLGAHYVSGGRNKKLTTKTQFHRMTAAYEKYRSGGLIPASFEIIQIHAKA